MLGALGARRGAGAVSRFEQRKRVDAERVARIAVSVARTALSGAGTALSMTGIAPSVAGIAVSIARIAVSVARTALSMPGIAPSVTGTAVPVAGIAISAARTAVSAARTAISVAGIAVSIARIAVSVAGIAPSVARTAVSVARTAVSVARTAVSVARTAVSVTGIAISVARIQSERTRAPGCALTLDRTGGSPHRARPRRKPPPTPRAASGLAWAPVVRCGLEQIGKARRRGVSSQEAARRQAQPEDVATAPRGYRFHRDHRSPGSRQRPSSSLRRAKAEPRSGRRSRPLTRPSAKPIGIALTERATGPRTAVLPKLLGAPSSVDGRGAFRSTPTTACA